ncbi:hypothetical protein Trco_002602 [Trichoderma cornu-damae]|uniref:Uncharacterized protein n=1 Tax=Trichoderma cornu-damae TaxID=654480 RepID=A0A9P8QQ80_9HYPO|nr:hypothetical protein Trco_002602 [Trichoderma cornu-damae]
MYAIAVLGAAAVALCSPAAAMPTAAPSPQLEALEAHLQPRADPTAPWVTVGDEGTPVQTVTPKVTTVSGTPTLVDVAPHDITASVYTWTSWGAITTSTGRPPNPTALSNNNDGVFARCYNKDGDDAPFCTPYRNSTLLTGSTYYITWDPDYYNKTSFTTNTTYEVTVRLDYLNKTSNEWAKLETYDDDRVPASWGFWPLQVTKDMLKGEKTNNVTITLLVAPQGSKDKNSSIAIPVAFQNPSLPHNPDPQVPKGHTLSIALPLTFGFIVFVVVGVFMWNRKTRRIELGNIMSRSRHGYNGRKARRNIFRSKKNVGSIQLHNADDHMSGEDYHDAPIPARRDSEALGSLAGTPIHETFEQQGTTGGHRNAFRDEVARQNQERRGGY